MSQVNTVMSPEALAALMADLERVKAENAALKAKTSPKESIKISEKGCISVYGLGRFPVALYRSQWLKLFTMIDKVKAFIEANQAQLDTFEENREAKKAADKAEKIAA